jgi:hypothetical protein
MRLLYTTAFSSVLLAVTSCGDLLDTEPYQQLEDERAIVDEGSARAALLGAYSNLQSYYSLNYPVLGYLPADNVQFNGTLNQYLQLDQNALTADNVIITDTWTQIYKTINSANNVIAAEPDVTDPAFTAIEKDQVAGEAYFLRALSYFDLARGWGGVPLVTKPTRQLTDGTRIKRSTLSQTYDQVLADLTNAEQRLPEASTRNRAVKNSARALRARLHLYRGQWAEAEVYATQVIANTGAYTLVKPYKIFFTAPFLSTESVFELSFSTADQNNQWNNWYPSQLGGQYTLQPTQTFIAQANDAARGGSRKALLGSVTTGNTTAIYGVLYNRDAQRDDPAYVIRLAEIYLIRAEARAHLSGKEAEALADLNTVRARADLNNLTLTSADDILLAIEAERSIEFAFEAHRWFDLVRTKRADDVLGITDERKWLFPIPFVEINADPDLASDQNPGYN